MFGSLGFILASAGFVTGIYVGFGIFGSFFAAVLCRFPMWFSNLLASICMWFRIILFSTLSFTRSSISSIYVAHSIQMIYPKMTIT